MSVTILLTLAFAALLTLEWRYRLKSVRLLTVAIAVLLWVFLQPNLTRARRRALDTPAAERVTAIADYQLSEYASGVHTLTRTIGEDATTFAKERLLIEAVLLWLACSPILRRARGLSDGAKATDRANAVTTT